jgi:hypothetical protein
MTTPVPKRRFAVATAVTLPDADEAAAPPPPPQPSPVTPDAPPPQASPLATAREIVERARDSALTEPGRWEPFTIRIPESVKGALDKRWLADRRGLGDYRLAQAHYAEAALSAIPSGVEEAAAWGEAWRAKYPAAAREQTVPAGSRVRRTTGRAMRELSGELQVRQPRVPARMVIAAAIMRLLDRLDAEDGHREVDH